MGGAVPMLLVYTFMAWKGNISPFFNFNVVIHVCLIACEQDLPVQNVAVQGSVAGLHHNAASQKTLVPCILVAAFRYCVRSFLNSHYITRYLERIRLCEICTKALRKEVGPGGVINCSMSGSNCMYHPV